MQHLVNDIHAIAQEIDHFARGQEVIGLLDGDFDEEFILDVHANFGGVQTVQAKILVKSTIKMKLVGVDFIKCAQHVKYAV